MQFIAQHTAIPVPKVICVFKHGGKTYIFRERIEGNMVGKGWPNRSDESKTNSVEKMIQELRSLPPPPGTAIGNVDCGLIYDGRLPGFLISWPVKQRC